jgi:hypothetical protein
VLHWAVLLAALGGVGCTGWDSCADQYADQCAHWLVLASVRAGVLTIMVNTVCRPVSERCLSDVIAKL